MLKDMKAVLVMLGNDEEKLEETVALAQAVNYDIVCRFIQKKFPKPKYLIGSGKVEEIKRYIEKNETALVVFENLLTTAQVLALEEKLKIPVIDKFDLILNIFELHARSREAKLQIELARLKRKIPYIKSYLGKKVKQEHPGFGGSGEFIIRNTITGIKRRISKIETELERFECRVLIQTERRRELGKIVSLAGYTNVGKTTLLNALAHTSQDVKDEPFTTLRTKTASLDERIFINDTIGYLRDLPHDLIYAFKATFSDIKNSNLILFVLDASEPLEEFIIKKEVGEKILNEIGAAHIPVLYVMNKADKADKNETEIKKRITASANSDCIEVSALYGTGIAELKHKIKRILNSKT